MHTGRSLGEGESLLVSLFEESFGPTWEVTASIRADFRYPWLASHPLDKQYGDLIWGDGSFCDTTSDSEE